MNAPYLRLADDRRGREREGALDVYGALLDPNHDDRYGHVMPGNEEEAAGLLDAHLGGAAAG
jgi:hypothetical protein